MYAVISHTVECHKKCSREQFEEWLLFELGVIEEMDNKNPLADTSLFLSVEKLEDIEIFENEKAKELMKRGD